MKKIAICFSGGIRNFDTCIPSIMKNFINPLKQDGNIVDIFLYLTYINEIDNKIDVKFKMVKSNYNQEKLLNVLKPKKFKIIEYNSDLQKGEMNLDGKNYMNYWDNEKDRNYGFSAFGMYAKIYKCNLLKKEYEEENNFRYDFVWRARMDYIFLDKITLDMIDLTEHQDFKDNHIYLIKDRFAHNTNRETNDKFIGGSSRVMDLVSNIYLNLQKYLDIFKQKKEMFEGQSIITYRINELKNTNRIIGCQMIGHRNTYYKCQGRHVLKISRKKVFINTENYNLFYNLAYKLLYQGYQVFSNNNNHILELFPNYTVISNIKDNIDFCVIDTGLNIPKDIKKRTYILSDNVNEVNNSIDKINKIKNLLNKLNIEDNGILNISFNNNLIKRYVYIHYLKELDISSILFSLIDFKTNHKVYKLTNNIFEPDLNETVRYYIPDRGKYLGKILAREKIFKNPTKYNIGEGKNPWYVIDEIEVLDFDKHIKNKYIMIV